METADLQDPVVETAFLRCRLAMRSVLGEEAFSYSDYWLDDEPEVEYEDGDIVFVWPNGRQLCYRIGRDEIMEVVTERAWLSCRIVSPFGKVLSTWRQPLSDPALN